MIVRPFDTPFVVKEPVIDSSILTSPSTFPDNVTDPLTSPFTFTGPLIFPFTDIPSIPATEPTEIEPTEPYVVIAPVIAAFGAFSVIPPSILPDNT